MAMITRFPRLRPQRHRPCVRASRLSQMPQRRALSDDTNAEEHSTDQSARLQDSQVPDGKSNRKTLRALQEEHWAEKANKMQAGVEKRILAVLEERGLVKDIAGGREALDHVLVRKRIGVYVGVDPTAPSLHIGHLLPLMVLYWMYLYGYPAVSLIGTATVNIGDPSGRTSARTPQDRDAIMHNRIGINSQVKSLWRNVHGLALKHGVGAHIHKLERYIWMNHYWHDQLKAMELVGVLGSGMRLGSMLNRDSVQTRLQNGSGMSLAEFCYPLFQGYDWWRMYHQSGVQLQVGGSDQYGNICAGIEAVDIMRRHMNPEVDLKKTDKGAYGLTTPLLTTASGEKFGKSAGNAVWLDPLMMNSYDLYKYMLGTADADVERYLKLFTFIPIENISMVMEAQRASPSKRLAQHLLAREMVELAHGAFRAKAAEQEHKHAFAIGTNLFSLGVLRNILARAVTDTRRGPHQAEEEEDPKKKAKIESLVKYKLQFAAAAGGASSQASNATTTPAPAAKDNMVTLPYTFVARSTLPQLLHATGLVSSKSEAQRLIRNNGAYVVVPGSGEPETPLNLKWDKIAEKSNPTDFLLDFQALVVRSGKKDIRICRVVKDKEFEEMGLDFPGWEEFRAMHAEAETGAEAVKTEMPEQTTGEEAAAKQ